MKESGLYRAGVGPKSKRICIEYGTGQAQGLRGQMYKCVGSLYCCHGVPFRLFAYFSHLVGPVCSADWDIDQLCAEQPWVRFSHCDSGSATGLCSATLFCLIVLVHFIY